MSRGRAVALVLASVAITLAGDAAVALETDQFAAWRKPLADCTAVVNAKINLEVQRALDELNRRDAPSTCEDVAVAVRRRLEFEIFQPLELWALQSPLIERFPTRGDEEERFLHESIYRRARPYDIAFWMPLSPTIEVNGVRIGTDKLAHFVSSGWKYRNTYLRRIARGETPAQAELGAIRWGILEERSINGSLSNGVFSRSDLEANHAGMLFYLGLCGSPDATVSRDGGSWQVANPYDLGPNVTPEWDESFLLPLYRKGRWAKVRPEIAASCGTLADRLVEARLADYLARDAETPSEQVVDELARAGHLPDPTPFTLAAVCPSRLPPAPARRVGQPPSPPAEIADDLVALERDRIRRVFGLWRGAVSSPLSLTVTFGALIASIPRTYDCRSLCELRGVTVHASAGLTGAEIAAGWARMFAESGRRRRFLQDVPLAYGFRGAVMRTWGDSPLTPAVQTLAGAEVALTITRVSFTAGAFLPIAGGAHRHRPVFTGSIGFGF